MLDGDGVAVLLVGRVAGTHSHYQRHHDTAHSPSSADPFPTPHPHTVLPPASTCCLQIPAEEEEEEEDNNDEEYIHGGKKGKEKEVLIATTAYLALTLCARASMWQNPGAP